MAISKHSTAAYERQKEESFLLNPFTTHPNVIRKLKERKSIKKVSMTPDGFNSSIENYIETERNEKLLKKGDGDEFLDNFFYGE